MEVLEGLGEEVMQSLVWQMGLKGVSFSPDTFDIKVFSATLQELFGDGAESLLEEIYQNAVCRLDLLKPFAFSKDNNGISVQGSRAIPSPLHKLLTLFGEVPANDGKEKDSVD